MFNIGDYVLDKSTNEKYQIYNKNKKFYLVRCEDGSMLGKFEWELEKYNFIKKVLKGVKKNGKNRK